jgi:hypothetical protein
MSIKNKSSKRYSYTNHDTRDRKFINKDFNKTDSYHSNFSGTLFQNTSFIDAKFKFCALYGTKFENCFIRGSLFRRCNITNATFRNTIISATVFDRCKLNNCVFDSCKIISSTKLTNFLKESCFRDTDFFTDYPPETEFNPLLLKISEGLRANDFIRQSTVLHRKIGKLDTVSLKVLVEMFGEEFLIKNLNSLPSLITNQFHTLSYIVRVLQKIQDRDKKESPGSVALGAPILTNECSSTD